MTTKRISAPFDLMSELESDDDEPKKQTITRTTTTVAPPTPPKPAPKPTLTKTTTTVAPKAASKPIATTPAGNGLFKPLTTAQKQMLKVEYYDNKNMTGRDKLYYALKRKHPNTHPTQKAINHWLLNQKVHQIHRRQFRSQTVTPIKGIRVPNQLWMADLIDMGKIPDNGYKWVLTVYDVFSKYAWARATKNKEGRTIAVAMADILKSTKPRLLQTDNGSEFIAAPFQAVLKQ
jgi:hypothetical protein